MLLLLKAFWNWILKIQASKTGFVSHGFSGTAKARADFSIVLCGEAGQGLQTIFHFLSEALKNSGYHIFSSKEYMSRIRGGSNSVELRVGSGPMYGRIDRIDLLLPLDEDAYSHLEKRLTKDTAIIGEKSTKESEAHKRLEPQVIDLSFTSMASQLGNKVFANTIAAGVVIGLFKSDIECLNRLVRETFAGKGEEIVSKNLEAAKQGYEAGVNLRNDPRINVAKIDSVERHDEVKEHVFLNGAEAIGLGAIAGGCNFISAYPMSPSTGVLGFLAKHRFTFSIIVEQAEDEISGINMALGAWYAGARALANTSGGGFALMEEGLSLAGITETPVVVHIAQRPGPATGLPTRTAQEDLNLALYAGHGEFPRAIYAPGTEMEGFFLTQKAFNMADKYQVPVFVLSDQYFMDAMQNISVADFGVDKFSVEHHVSATAPEYKRYAFAEDGVSPRGIPGGPGLVCADSDEHDEGGRITESMDIRNKMVEKRWAKNKGLIEEAVPPKEHGTGSYKYLIISWGSTYGAVREAFEKLGRDDTAFIHYSQVYPLHPSTAGFIGKAQKAFVVEQNFTGQFAKIIQKETNLATESILKYDGIAFSVEELTSEFEKRLK